MPIELTVTQRQIWASQRRFPDFAVQNMATLTHLNGAIDPEKFARAFQAVVRASDVLRTQISGKGKATATISPAPPTPTKIVKIHKSDTQSWGEARVKTALDMAVCGYDSVLLQHEDGTASWYLNLHHLITDATASALIFEATAQAYLGHAPAEQRYYERSPPTANHAAERAVKHWTSRNTAPRVGTLYQTATRTAPLATQLDLPLSDALFDLAKMRLASDYRMLSHGLSWNSLLVTASALFLHRLSGATTFSIGLPVHMRQDPASARLIGPTMEMFPVDVAIEPTDTHSALFQRVSRAVMTTIMNAAPGTSPTGDYDMVMNAIPPSAAPDMFAGIPASPRWLHAGAVDPDHAFRLHMTPYTEANTGFQLKLDVNSGLASPAQMRRISGHFTAVLTALLEHPDGPIGAESLCGAPELSTLQSRGDGGQAEALGPLIPAQLEAALGARGDTAISAGADSLSGAELWQWVQDFADDLCQAGMPKGARIGICLPPSLEAVVAIFGTLLAGGSFVPLDPQQPLARRDELAKRAAIYKVFSTTTSVASTRPEGGTASEASAQKRLSTRAVSGADEAYLMFTSGSTGQPKPVPVSHEGLARYIGFARQSYFENGAPVAPLFGSLTFDLTITSLFAPLLAGGRLVAVAETGPAALHAIAQDTAITWCKATPSHLEILAKVLPAAHSLQTLVVGGEAFGRPLAEALHSIKPEMAIFNEYGPTEAVVGCMIYKLDFANGLTGSDVPIGAPAPGVTLKIMDPYGQPAPIGVAGELWIAHAGLTQGYDGMQGPFTTLDGTRFYRSGDLVRLGADGALRYLGRIDEEIKLGGIRLNPTEVEQALSRHPLIESAVVRLWSPAWAEPVQHCARCGLPDNVPAVQLDSEGICDTCRAYDTVRDAAQSWFKTQDDLKARLAAARARSNSKYDCMHLLSGGKDSTYTLCRLVDLGYHPYVFTFDNGFIPASVKENIRRVVSGLRLDHEFATTPAMKDIFRDSLASHSNVCNGCFKTIYTLATNRAEALGLSLIVTGLSRGQLFETRLIPAQFSAERFDPDAIDRAVIHARKVYHQLNDLPNRLLDTEIFKDDTLFDRIEYLDFFRYEDVELAEMLRYLAERTTWRRPEDTGRSTNCLINVLGVSTHRIEQGYHNYAVPYAWDVRLGHKTRQEAIDELEDKLDAREISELQAELGYTPKARQTLTGWLVPNAGQLPTPAELRRYLGDILPAHAIPKAFVEIERIPLSKNGKIDTAALPAPLMTHRAVAELEISPQSETERAVIAVWERILRLEPIGVEDDFFALGGDSLAALEMIISVGEACDLRLPDDMAFGNTTPKALATAIDDLRLAGQPNPAPRQNTAEIPPRDTNQPPPLSVGEQTILFDHSAQPDRRMYNVCRIFRVHGPVEAGAFEQALRKVAARHQPLSWSYATPRKPLTSSHAITVQAHDSTIPAEGIDDAVRALHRPPFDLENGPLMRCLIQPVADGSTLVAFAIHHISGDHESFDVLWAQINDDLSGRPLTEISVGYAGFCDWQQGNTPEKHRDFWLTYPPQTPPNPLLCLPPAPAEADGFLIRHCDIRPQELRAVRQASPVAVAIASAVAALRPYYASDDIGLALVASSRTHPLANPLFGYFLNPLPMQLTCAAEATLASLVQLASAAMGRVLPHRSHPLAHIIAERRAENLALPDINVLLSYDDAVPAALKGTPVSQQVAFNGYAVADLAFFVEVREDTVEVSLEYSGTTIGAKVAGAIIDRFSRALAQAVRAPQSVVEALSQTPAPQSLLVGPALEDDTLILAQITRHMADTPDAIAVECGGVALTWAELDSRSRIIATTLRARGVKLADKVIVHLPRSVNLVAAIIGVLRVGATYVPLDPSYPRPWLEAVIDAVQATHAITASGGVARHEIRLDEHGINAGAWAEQPTPKAPETGLDGNSPAYVIFTSGSTGTPKGVCVTHAQLAASTNARFQAYNEAPRKFALLSSVAFDSSLVGLFWTLASGGTVVLPREEQAHDVDALAGLLGNSGATHTLCVPTLYSALLARKAAQGLTGWPQQVIVAGETCPAALLAIHFASTTAKLSNEYGVTEATVWSSVSHLDADTKTVSIGQPIAGAWLAITDPQGQICPQGIAGELVIGGLGVSAGYLSAPDTGTKFFQTAAHPVFGALAGTHYYRSGDQAVMVDGEVRFVGRMDQQINIGGARIEPAQIEHILAKSGSVKAAVVVAQDARPLAALLDTLPDEVVAAAIAQAGKSGAPKDALRKALAQHGVADLRLVAHLEVAPPFDEAKLRAAVSAALPQSLRPTDYVTHTALPRMPNGKLDRTACEALPITPPARASSAQNGSTVATLTSLFQQELRVPEFKDTDSFFDHGGHSLMVLNLVLSIEEKLGTPVSTSALFEAPTPRALARVIKDAPITTPTTTPTAARGLVIPIQPDGDLPPLFAIQNLGDDCKHIRPLSARLGPNQPVFGLGDPVQATLLGAKVDDPSKPHDIQAIAAVYVREIVRIAPDGPFSLLAICGGVAVAYEVAQQLAAQGRTPDVLAMVTDWHAPFLQPEANVQARHIWRQKWHRLRREGVGYLAGILRNIPLRIKSMRLNLLRKQELKALHAANESGQPLSKPLQARAYLERAYLSMHNYIYRAYGGKVLVLRGDNDPDFFALPADAGWGDLLPNASFARVPGYGVTLMQEPDVEHVAAQIRQALPARADGKNTLSSLPGNTMAR